MLHEMPELLVVNVSRALLDNIDWYRWHDQSHWIGRYQIISIMSNDFNLIWRVMRQI